MILLIFLNSRVLTTPTEETWPGVSSLPDYKANFPKWTNYNLRSHLKNLNEDGVDLLQKMLVYNPAERISAKKIAVHPYFKNIDKSIVPDLK